MHTYCRKAPVDVMMFSRLIDKRPMMPERRCGLLTVTSHIVKLSIFACVDVPNQIAATTRASPTKEVVAEATMTGVEEAAIVEIATATPEEVYIFTFLILLF